MDSFSNEANEMVRDILNRRNEIKDDFCKAYLASVIPEGADVDWIIQNIELVEQQTKDPMCVKWYFKQKTPPTN